MSAARQEFVRSEAQIIRDALDYLHHEAVSSWLMSGCFDAHSETHGQRDDALAALDRLEELAGMEYAPVDNIKRPDAEAPGPHRRYGSHATAILRQLRVLR